MRAVRPFVHFSPADWLARPGLEVGSVVVPHRDVDPGQAPRVVVRPRGREEREDLLDRWLSPGATRCFGAGQRVAPEDPDPIRTPHERDLHRVIHSTTFRRLAGKTQVVTSPPDHVRTRLTHSLGVAQISQSICEALGLDATLGAVIAAAHDVAHGPGGHAAEEAIQEFIPGFDHATWGADAVLTHMNLCAHTLDAVRNHSWSRPSPATPEGSILSIADRVEYVVFDLADGIRMGLVRPSEVPSDVVELLGLAPRDQVSTLVAGVVDAVLSTGMVSLPAELAHALDRLRTFNYEHIYTSAIATQQRKLVIPIIRALVRRYATEPALFGRTDLDDGSDEAIKAAVTYVVGMTDRFAARAAVELCGWDESQLPCSAW